MDSDNLLPKVRILLVKLCDRLTSVPSKLASRAILRIRRDFSHA